ncbi:hypothetical protein ACFWM1_26400 [Nocardia sp. NPDC058379]|uniref:hypothetical protein n=1 Tax=unclassified Nocardia TaxID=2637762 RepID=UPI0036549114
MASKLLAGIVVAIGAVVLAAGLVSTGTGCDGAECGSVPGEVGQAQPRTKTITVTKTAAPDGKSGTPTNFPKSTKTKTVTLSNTK